MRRNMVPSCSIRVATTLTPASVTPLQRCAGRGDRYDRLRAEQRVCRLLIGDHDGTGLPPFVVNAFVSPGAAKRLVVGLRSCRS